MYLKREVDSSSIESHPPSHSVAIAPPVPGANMSESAVIPQQGATHKTSSEEQNPFENTSDKDKKLSFMQDDETNSFEIVSAPTVYSNTLQLNTLFFSLPARYRLMWYCNL
jgi:hypothetical protein